MAPVSILKVLLNYGNYRISYIEEEIATVDKKIEEIKQLEKEKASLLSRMQAIEQLQKNRSLIVRFFDELITSLPEGISVTRVAQAGNSITIGRSGGVELEGLFLYAEP